MIPIKMSENMGTGRSAVIVMSVGTDVGTPNKKNLYVFLKTGYFGLGYQLYFSFVSSVNK